MDEANANRPKPDPGPDIGPNTEREVAHEDDRDREAEAGNTDLADAAAEPRADEIGGPKGPEPTRYGDWERKGRCIDF